MSIEGQGAFHSSENLGEDGVEKALLWPFGLSVRLQSGTEAVRLQLTGSETEKGSTEEGILEETRFHYRSEDESIQARIFVREKAGGTMLVSVEAGIANENDFGKQRSFAGEHAVMLTLRPAGQIEGLMANYQHKDWWTRPHFGTDLAGLPEKMQSVLWKTADGYGHLLPVTGPVWRADAAGAEEGITLRLSAYEEGHTRCEALVFAFAAGSDPYDLVKRNVASALKELDYPTLPREQKPFPAMLDKLGWCSWDAFYHQVSEEGLLAKAAELQQLGLPVGWVMIDDGWSDISAGKLSSFEADPIKFPGGLKRAVHALKERYGIRHVGVWHTIAGYWGGILEDSPIARTYADHLYRVPRGNLIPYPEAGKGFAFWHAWHGFLRRQGVDFVKVDSQSAVLNYLQGRMPIGQAAAAAHEALEASVALHFDGTIINCMGMASENIWHRPKSAVSRNSDDFVPQEKRGFPEHALQNGYNSFYHGAFYWGDWDMYWSKNHDDVQSAVLRAVSGGPVYISDAPGNTDPSRIWPLIYADGSVIRCDETANPTPDCLLLNPAEEQVPLKLWNRAGSAGVVAAFHISGDSAQVMGSIGPADVPGLGGGEFAVYDHFAGKGWLMRADEQTPIRLEEGGCALYTVVPVTGSVTPVGLADKYISPAAVAGCTEVGKVTNVRLREGGRFVFASKTPPLSVTANGQTAEASPIGGEPGDFYEVLCGEPGQPVQIEIVSA
ncbi:Sip1-related alpha-galactosidase [Paenibacillus cellulositrophicus]|uniref:Sip1-related alpha-galactosidase n=1 Tax=Paenibacillus cellulositrophicus TaxID=562959 RepID=UPI00203F44C2|nr:Sip1-related alpha-galactosidase [Paenibacillus cellulositrophicus]MCM3001493.1 hypothetical protein [Paenibacillus cellulositrophicus]